MNEYPSDSAEITKEEIETITDFEAVMKIVDEVDEDSETLNYALDRALDIATTINQFQRIAEAALEGSTQKTRAISNMILLAEDLEVLPVGIDD